MQAQQPSLCETDVTGIGVLVHSYGACGELETAVSLFESGVQKGLVFDGVGWTSLLGAYAQRGMIDSATQTFERMITAGVKPNVMTISCLLNAASHAGLGLGVRDLYHQLQSRFPDIQFNTMHRNCVVDGLARKGLLDEAVAEARSVDNVVAWMAVMGGARTYDRVDIGELALAEVRRLDPANAAGACVLMAHMYTKSGRHADAVNLRQDMKAKGLRKIPGETSIEIKGVIHTFRVNDTRHPEMKQIIARNYELHEQLRAQGYTPDVEWVDRGPDVTDEEKAQLLCEHSERLALVYGLMHSEEGEPLTLFKNLRVCGDCHDATKHISSLLKRKITVMDANRWHVFENGKCSCDDFW